MKTNSKNSELDEKVVKQRIVGKYGFVDQAEDNRYHRPIIKKEVSSRMNNNDYLKIYLYPLQARRLQQTNNFAI